MDEIRDAGKATKKAYSYTMTEVQGPRNDEVRQLRRSYQKYVYSRGVSVLPAKRRRAP
jgi:hypothetical protein